MNQGDDMNGIERPVTILVMAKAPVPGQAKTRLTPPLTPQQAADVAAASLLDTLAAALAASREGPPVVAMTGDLASAARSAELAAALAECEVVPQRGADFGERLVAAHAHVADRGRAVLQIGMDTPQVTAADLRQAVRRLHHEGALLGPAPDGGWWALGLQDPLQAGVLAAVPMSSDTTGDRTREALEARGLVVGSLPEHRDVDEWNDALVVAGEVGTTRFAAAVRNAASTLMDATGGSR